MQFLPRPSPAWLRFRRGNWDQNRDQIQSCQRRSPPRSLHCRSRRPGQCLCLRQRLQGRACLRRRATLIGSRSPRWWAIRLSGRVDLR